MSKWNKNSYEAVYWWEILKNFEEVGNAGSEITYRFNKCQDCKNCKEHEQNEIMSIKEKIEQDLTNKLVSVDIKKRITIAVLPFMFNPLGRIITQ